MTGAEPEPWLSVVVPVLDEAPNLARLLPTLASVPGVETLVVDGGSGDGSAALVARHPTVRWMASTRGRAPQMNAGARAARGRILLFLHADTCLPDGALDGLRGALASGPAVGGRFDVRLDSRRPAFRAIEWFMNTRSRLTGISTGDQAIFVRRTVFETLGGFADIPLMEDIEFSRRLRRRGALACLRLRVTTSARKWEREGIVRTVVLMWTLRFLYFCGVDPGRLHRWYYGHPPGSMTAASAEAPPGDGTTRHRNVTTDSASS